jgi:hypothetical protein
MRFSYIHLSDPHFCLEPTRQNALTLFARNPRHSIDTTWKQVSNLGFLSLAKPASFVPEIVSGVAQFCFERQSVIDGIICTGDLATTGLMSDLDVAHSFLANTAADGFVSENGSPTINFPGVRIYVLPGNHDKFVSAKGTPNCKNFELKFENYMDRRHYRSGVGHWLRRKGGQTVGIISADFTLESRGDARDKAVGVYGQGRVYQHVLDELKARTLTLRRQHKDVYLLWAIHFAPFDCGYNLELIDWREIIGAASNLRVLATLCGHTHMASKFEIERHKVYCSGSAGCVDSERNSRVHMIHVDIDGDCHISRDNYLWHSNNHEFSYYDTD